MWFVTPALLAGIVLVGVPIVLHLVMRREARQLVFPALRFVEQRKTLNQHRLRLRHLLLLALRCAIIGLLAFALARPILRGSGATAKEDQPVAAALVFDNSLRMSYLENNQTRLELAQELAGWLLEQLPRDCPLAVIDRGTVYGSRDLDRSAAELRVERLSVASAARPFEETLRDAVDWLGQQTDHRGEIYVFTDLAAVEWTPNLLADLATRLGDLPSSNVYVIDVGVRGPRNLSLEALRVSAEELTPGGLLQLETELAASGQTGASEEVTVELYLEEPAGGTQKRGQQVVAVPGDDESAPVEFSLAGLGLGVHQGSVRIVADDPLEHDDTRYFTVEVRAPRKVLLLGEERDDALFLREALAPSSAAGLLPSRFNCETRALSDLDNLPLADFDAVCLVDPTPLATAAWQALADYVHAGGGLGIFLGRHARRDEFNQPAPQQLLPAMLRWQSRDATYLRPSAVGHPALATLGELVDVAPWPEFPVYRYWELESPADDVYVVAHFANGQPALLDRAVGTGQVVTMTTPVSDPAADDPWNLLPTGPDPWPFLALAGGLADYLTGAGGEQRNYLAGQTVVLRLAPKEQVTSFALEMPAASAVRQSLAPGQTDLSITSTDALGNYRVRAGGRQARLDRGFSVNAPAENSRLARADFAAIESVLGKDRVRLARTREEIEVRVGLGRVGRELFPALILVLVVVLAAEQLLANRFYRSTE